MRAKLAALLVACCLAAAVLTVNGAPQAPRASVLQPDFNMVNCSGFYSDQKLPEEFRVISGEQSNIKITFTRGDYIYINRGQDKGVRVGDRFNVVRPDANQMGVQSVWIKETDVPWFKWQQKLMKAMGTPYIDAGQVRVVNVQPKVSIAQVNFSCDYMQRGDVLVPYQDRPSPPFKDRAAFDHFAPVSGKPVAMLVIGKDLTANYGQNSTVYVNLGTSQGVKVGDYYRIFRYQGSHAETVPQTKGYQYTMYGYGSAPERYQWNDLPREILGDGIVFNVSRNSSTMMITFSHGEIYAGDYVEVE